MKSATARGLSELHANALHVGWMQDCTGRLVVIATMDQAVMFTVEMANISLGLRCPSRASAQIRDCRLATDRPPEGPVPAEIGLTSFSIQDSYFETREDSAGCQIQL